MEHYGNILKHNSASLHAEHTSSLFNTLKAIHSTLNLTEMTHRSLQCTLYKNSDTLTPFIYIDKLFRNKPFGRLVPDPQSAHTNSLTCSIPQ